MCSVCWPIVPWIFQISLLAFGIFVFSNQVTLSTEIFKVGGLDNTCHCAIPNQQGEFYANGSFCDPVEFSTACSKTPSCEKAYCHFISREDSSELCLQKILNGFFCLWSLFFISALSQLILASTFAIWYWTYNKSQVPVCVVCKAVAQTLRYNIGTVAFGSLIITICRILRLMVEYVDNQCKKYQNSVTKAILCVFRCFFWCLENFLKFVNSQAYIMTAINGTNFCKSAKDGFLLLTDNCLRDLTLGMVS